MHGAGGKYAGYAYVFFDLTSSRRHLFRDLCPYVCMDPGCQDETLFDSVEQWYGHMQWEHQLVWSCGAPAHESVFESASDLAGHMRLKHPGTFADGQLDAILENSARPMTNPFTSCPLCLSDFREESASLELRTSEPDQAYLERRAREHIALHMEAIALFSLPEEFDVESSNKTQQRASHGISIDEEIHTLPTVDALSDADADHEDMLSQEQRDFPECPKDPQGGYMEVTVEDIPAKARGYYSHHTDQNMFPLIVRNIPTMQLPQVAERPQFVTSTEFEMVMRRWRKSPLLYLSHIPQAQARSLAGYMLSYVRALDTPIEMFTVSIEVLGSPEEDVSGILLAILKQIAEQRDELLPILMDAIQDHYGDATTNLLEHMRRAIKEPFSTAIVFAIAEPLEASYMNTIRQLLNSIASWKDPGLSVLVLHRSSTQLFPTELAQIVGS